MRRAPRLIGKGGLLGLRNDNYFLRDFAELLDLDVFDLLPDERTVRPRRPSLLILPTDISCSYAPRPTFRATLSDSASSRSLGRKDPAARAPVLIRVSS